MTFEIDQLGFSFGMRFSNPGLRIKAGEHGDDESQAHVDALREAPGNHWPALVARM